jgi:predicted permease
MREKILLWKDRLVMPLDIYAKQQKKKRQLMSTVLIIFCVLGAVTIATAFLTIFSRNPTTVSYILLSVFHNSGYIPVNSQFLAIVHIIVYSGAIMILFYSPSC